MLGFVPRAVAVRDEIEAEVAVSCAGHVPAAANLDLVKRRAVDAEVVRRIDHRVAVCRSKDDRSFAEANAHVAAVPAGSRTGHIEVPLIIDIFFFDLLKQDLFGRGDIIVSDSLFAGKAEYFRKRFYRQHRNVIHLVHRTV